MEMEARMGKERESKQMREKERMRGEKKKVLCAKFIHCSGCSYAGARQETLSQPETNEGE